MTTSALDLPAPVAPRLRRPGWRDPRLLVGLALVAASVALGSWAVRSAQATAPVLLVRQATVPGAALDADGLAVADVRLGSAELDRYVRADEPLAPDAVALRVVGAGELLPRSAVGSADDLALRPVAVPAGSELPASVGAGSLVDLWLTPAAPRGAVDGAQAQPPRQLAAALTVAEVGRAQGALAAGGAATVHVLVPVGQLPDVLAALASDGRVDVVAVPGS
jgi:hypothetical protein